MKHGTGPAPGKVILDNTRLDSASSLLSPGTYKITLLPRALAVFVAVLASLCGVRAQTTASVSTGALPSPIFVNIYWDQTWDGDNPSMTMNRIDNFTSALVNSSYMSGLAEYGFTSGTVFPASFVANPACGNGGNAPAPVAFYNAWYPLTGNPGIIQFLSCEIHNGYVPFGFNFVYNLFLPPLTLERDTLEEDLALFLLPPFTIDSFTSCVKSNPVGYHYRLPALDAPNVDTVPPFVAFTVNYSNPVCLTPAGFTGFTENVAHEIVETVSDASPSLSVILSGSGEIGDICAPGGTLSTGAPAPGAGTSTFLTPFGAGTTENYWTNAGQTCLLGFSSRTTPFITAINLTDPEQTGTSIGVSVQGLGFGTLPPVTTFVANSGTVVDITKGPALLPYFAIQDLGPSSASPPIWEGGNSLNSDTVMINFLKWSNSEIDIQGASRSGSPITAAPGDLLNIIVCNPSSGICTANTIRVPAATITGLSPNIGPAAGNTTVTVSVTGFTGNMQNSGVLFGDRQGTVTAISPTQVTVVSPMSRPGPVKVKLLTDHSPSTDGDFTYCHPQVQSIAPNSSPNFDATTVTITGTCFTGAQEVTFGLAGTDFIGTPQAAIVDDTHVRAIAPAWPDAPFCRAAVEVMSPDLDGLIGGPETSADLFFYGSPIRCPSFSGIGASSNPCAQDPSPCLSLLGLSSIVTAGQPLQAPEFSDLGAVAWAASAIKHIVSQGVLQGVSAHQFGPDRPVTRSDFATGLARTLNFRTPAQLTVFSDVNLDDPTHALLSSVQPYMIAFRDRTGAVSFHGALPVQRQEVALTAINVLVASRKVSLLNADQSEEILKHFSDAKLIPPAIRRYFATAVEHKILATSPADKQVQRPQSRLSRAEFASLLFRLEQFFSEK